jgi:hypothetical protein
VNLAELIRRVRVEANDATEPYFWRDQDITDWLNDAVAEAVIRGRLIHENINPEVCKIDVTLGQSDYPLHPALYEITHLRFHCDALPRPLRLSLVSTQTLDDIATNWREQSDHPRFAIQNENALRLVPNPIHDGTLYLEGYRLPLSDMLLSEQDTAEPEIYHAHHRHLVQWALYKGFSIPDMEAFDPSRAAIAESAFSIYFGQRPDANLRRMTREDVTHHVEAFWP